MSRCLVIAEAGVNHDGSLEKALELVDLAAEAGADIVKFQTFKADRLVINAAPKANYQLRQTDAGESQYGMLKRLELDAAMHMALAARCAERGIEFLSTAFDVESLKFLIDEIGIKRVKIPSGDATNGPLLQAAARSGLPILLSTGMCSLAEVSQAVALIAFVVANPEKTPDRASLAELERNAAAWPDLRDRLTLLHCTTEYPAPIDEVHLRAMDRMRDAFSVSVGFSDHTEGAAVSLAAVARGATVIEKHFTLSRTLPGPDHAASLEPEELNGMVRDIRIIEKALGEADKKTTASELKNRPIARKSLMAAVQIPKGALFSEQNLTAKRPGLGRSPMEYWDLLGKAAWRDFEIDEIIS